MEAEQADFRRAGKLARQVLDDNVVDRPPVPIFDLVRQYGLGISEAFFAPPHDNVAGYIDMEKQRIVLNRGEPTTRKVFTLAHELGHWLLHRERVTEKPALTILLRTATLKDQPRIPVEQEANCFAAELLVPGYLLEHYKAADDDLIARLFGVSRDVIRYRLHRR
jgi:Zn-dependent peptidase ImmA (M78 family)